MGLIKNIKNKTSKSWASYRRYYYKSMIIEKWFECIDVTMPFKRDFFIW